MRVNCEWCGRKFSKNSHYVRKAKNQFCSYECHGKWMKGKRQGGNVYDSDTLRRLKGIKKKKKVWFRP
jgi:hypothetical protein